MNKLTKHLESRLQKLNAIEYPSLEDLREKDALTKVYYILLNDSEKEELFFTEEC